MAMDAYLKFHIMNSVPIVCMALLLCCLQSEANYDNSSCKDKPTRCPKWLKLFAFCYCPDHTPVKFACVNGKWKVQHCDTSTTPATTTTKPTTPVPRCQRLPEIPFGKIQYSDDTLSFGTKAKYTCQGESQHSMRVCRWGDWDGEEPTCSCPAPPKNENQNVIFYPNDNKSGRYPFQTTATYYCRRTSYKDNIGILTCSNTGKWSGRALRIWNCILPRSTAESAITRKIARKTTKPPLHHTDERTVVIVSGTTGAILGALIILVVIVSCQRRIHYHRMRRARLRHRQDQDAFTAFITYHRDVRLILPSYDEAMNQQEQGQPPSFEEALGHYEEPTLPPGHTPASENPPSISTDSPTSSASPVSETRNTSETSTPPENDSDTAALVDGQSSVTPTSDNSRFLRSLRTLFGGRAFRPDAIYCRFVPQEHDESESSARTVEREPRGNATDEELTEVLARAGLC